NDTSYGIQTSTVCPECGEYRQAHLSGGQLRFIFVHIGAYLPDNQAAVFFYSAMTRYIHILTIKEAGLVYTHRFGWWWQRETKLLQTFFRRSHKCVLCLYKHTDDEDDGQPNKGDNRFHQRPRQDRIFYVQVKVLFVKPEAGVVYMRKEQTPRTG